jgi:tetratricopeptide (TPR) repeat protein
MRLFRRQLSLAASLAIVAASLACEKSSHDHLEEARKSLASSAYPEAVAAAQAGLAGEADDVATWGLELVILEAQARAGNGAETKSQLERLASAHPERISATDYSSSAQLLQAAGQKPTAIEILDLGLKRFPDDAVLAKMIEDSVASGSDPEELEMLRSLGYIE